MKDLVTKLRKSGEERLRASASDDKDDWHKQMMVVSKISHEDGKLMLEAAEALEALLGE